MVCEDTLDNEHHNNAVAALDYIREAIAKSEGKS